MHQSTSTRSHRAQPAHLSRLNNLSSLHTPRMTDHFITGQDLSFLPFVPGLTGRFYAVILSSLDENSKREDKMTPTGGELDSYKPEFSGMLYGEGQNHNKN